VAASNRRYYSENRDRLVSRQRERDLQRHEQKVASGRAYYRANRDRLLFEKRLRYAQIPDVLRARSHSMRAARAKAAGKHTAADVRSQFARQKGRCYWCGKKVGLTYHVDHVVPLSLGGSNGLENIVVSCAGCNLKKHAKHPMDFAGRLL